MSTVVRGVSNQKSLSELSIHTSRMATYISHRPPPFTHSNPQPQPPSSSSSPANRLLPRYLEPSVAFANFVSTVLESTQVNQLVVVLALLYLERYHRQRSLRPDVDIPTDPQLDPEHNLFLSSLLVANKVADDCNYTNRSFADVSGLSLPEVNAIERSFLRTISFDLWVSTEEFYAWLYRLTDLGKARHRALQAFVHPHQPFSPSFHQRLSTPLSAPGSAFASVAQVVPPSTGCYMFSANKSPKLASALLTPNSNSQRAINLPGGLAPRPFKRSAEDAFSSLDSSLGTDVRPIKKKLQPLSGISPTVLPFAQNPNPVVSALPTQPSSLYPSVQPLAFLPHPTPSAPIIPSYPYPHQLHLHQPSLPASRLYTQSGQPAYPSPQHPSYPPCAPHQTVLSAGYNHLLPHLYPYPFSYPFSLPDRPRPYDVIRSDPPVLPAVPATAAVAMAAVLAPFATLKASAREVDDSDKMSTASWQAIDRWRRAVVPFAAEEAILPWAGLDGVRA